MNGSVGTVRREEAFTAAPELLSQTGSMEARLEGRTGIDPAAGAPHPYGWCGQEEVADTLVLTAPRRDIGKEKGKAMNIEKDT